MAIEERTLFDCKQTQDEPAFCGISTMTMVLNALAVDPKRIWKGPWRWYHESMLDCCRDLEEIKKSGIEFDQFSCLGRYELHTPLP